MTLASAIFSSPTLIFVAAFLFRAVLLVYGIYQDSVSAFKYTDIDYYVFTDAARAVARGSSPYDRATYRYTPLLAWILLPTTRGGLWFHFGKAIFALSDLVAGWLIIRVLKRKGLNETKSLQYACVWLLNPMVANISTRGSSEGLLCVMVMALLWAFESGRIVLAGCLLGLSVHFKIYPFIYGVSMLWALKSLGGTSSSSTIVQKLVYQVNASRISLVLTSLSVFMGLNVLMYKIYGFPFLQHTFLHHVTRIDHRHNFSPYNMLLYVSSAGLTKKQFIRISFESLAFLPQVLLSTAIIPLGMARIDLPATMLAQTLAFVAFNKVCTSQYFLWYLIFLPLYLPNSTFVQRPGQGIAVLIAWITCQAIWLQQGYQLEFLGKSTFVPGLWLASILFFVVNCWILGIIVNETASRPQRRGKQKQDTARMRIPVLPPANGAPFRTDRKTSISGTVTGSTYIGPRNRVLKSTPTGTGQSGTIL